MAVILKNGKGGYPWNHAPLCSEVKVERQSPEFPSYVRAMLIVHLGPDSNAWSRVEQYVENVLLALGNQVELLITLAKGPKSESLLEQLEQRFSQRPNSRIVILENKGMDIGPFLWALNSLRQRPVSQQPHILIKIHSKTHDLWRQHLCEPLFATPMHVAKLVTHLSENASAGMLGSRYNIYNTQKHSGHNRQLIDDYLRSVRLPILDRIDSHRVGQLRFVGGTIFYARREVFDTLLNEADLFKWQEELAEARQTDAVGGQKTHALERIFGILVHLKNYKLVAV